jgi:maleylpyruvate isomerase
MKLDAVKLDSVKLYGYFRSSASYRVRIALGLKGIGFETIPIHLVKDGGEQKTASFKLVNLMQQVPVLEFEADGKTTRLTQSVAIIEYLDDVCPAPALRPTSPLQCARMRMLVEIVNSGTQPLQNLTLLQTLKSLGADELEFAKKANERGLTALEAEAGSSRYLVEDFPTIADICLVPQMFSARRFGVDLAPFPNLVRIDAELAKLDAVKAAHPESQPDFA